MTTLSDMTGVSERMRVERDRRGWSQEQAATYAGLSSQTWRRIENGDANISPKSRTAIANAFGWPVNWMELDADQLATPAPQPSQSSEQLDDIVERLKDVEALLRTLLRAVANLGDDNSRRNI